MTPVTLTWSAAWILMAAVAAIRLWRVSSTYEPFTRSGYRWLGVAALCLALGEAVQQTLGGAVGGPSPLRVADFTSLAALPALVVGAATLTVDRSEPDRGPAEPSRWRRYQDAAAQAKVSAGVALDSALLVVSLFAIGLVMLFGADYTRSGVGPGIFTLDLIRPVADLVALGTVLVLASRNSRLVTFPLLGLAAVTLADSLAVGGRSAGDGPGGGSFIVLLAGIALIAATPALPAGAAHASPTGSRVPWLAGGWSAHARMAAPAAAAMAALVIAGFAVFGQLVPASAVAVTVAIGVILLVLRLGLYARQAWTGKASARASDWAFHALADATGDAVLICDLSGMIEYASHGSSEFGYGHGKLAGTRLADIVHPEDRRAGIRAAITAVRTPSGTGTFSGRVRGADGSWRQVSAILARYGLPGEPVRLLITCRDDSELTALRRQLTQLTYHDGLTGLPNRTYLEDRIKDLSQADGQLSAAVILVSLDGYSQADEIGGQPAANLVIAQAGRRLRAAAPPGAVVARSGSAQFTVLVTDSDAPDPGDADWPQLADLGERLADAISGEPFAVPAGEVSTTASVGIATSTVAGADQLLALGYVALAKAVQAGGGRVELLSPQMREAVGRRAALAAELGEAIADHQLAIDYLPVVELATSLVTSVEAVVSWRSGGERIGADELFAVAEESGLMIELSEWLLREGIRQVAAWRADAGANGQRGATGWAGPSLGLAAPVSAAQLNAPGFAAGVLLAVDEAGLPPQALTLQADGQVLVDAAESVKAELAGLRGAGVRLAIDHFGAGYASLSFLRELAVDVIRIDRSLTAGLASDPTLTLLTSAIAGLARDLGIEVIAVGVEGQDQVDVLKGMGCVLGQGDWLAAQVPAKTQEPMAAGQAGDPACSPAS
jgi:diguanylate cyclase (GGDEF)-like protein/PAS domain S-box-containing protein